VSDEIKEGDVVYLRVESFNTFEARRFGKYIGRPLIVGIMSPSMACVRGPDGSTMFVPLSACIKATRATDSMGLPRYLDPQKKDESPAAPHLQGREAVSKAKAKCGDTVQVKDDAVRVAHYAMQRAEVVNSQDFPNG